MANRPTLLRTADITVTISTPAFGNAAPERPLRGDPLLCAPADEVEAPATAEAVEAAAADCDGQSRPADSDDACWD
jgi:hypothetical protein